MVSVCCTIRDKIKKEFDLTSWKLESIYKVILCKRELVLILRSAGLLVW